MANKMQKIKTIFRWIFNILCLLVVSLLFLVGIWTRNLHWLWLIVPIALWIVAFKRKLAGWLALGFLATIVCIIVWLFIPDSGNWRPYTFDYELKDLEANRAVPDSENAAIAYQKIIARLDINNPPKFYDEVNEPSTRIFWKGVDHPETAAFIDARATSINKMVAASTMEKCSFPLWTNPMDMPFDMSNRIRELSYLVLSAANRDMGERRIDEALEKYHTLIRLGRQLEYQTTFNQLMIGEAFENMAYQQLRPAIIDSNCTATQLDNIRQMLPTTDDDWPKLYPTIFENEKLLSKNLFGIALYEIDDKGTVRFRRSMPPIPSLKSLPAALPQKLMKLSAIGHWFIAPHDPKHLSQVIDEEFNRSKKLYDVNQLETESTADTGFHLSFLADPYRSTVRMMPQLILPAHAKIQQMYLRTIVLRRTMYIVLALREYKDANGRWPENLEQIKDKVPAEAMIDPFTGGSFIYKTKGDKFLLYSIGPNKIDEKGKPKPSCRDSSCRTDKSRSDDILILPQKYEQAKEFFDANTPAAK